MFIALLAVTVTTLTAPDFKGPSTAAPKGASVTLTKISETDNGVSETSAWLAKNHLTWSDTREPVMPLPDEFHGGKYLHAISSGSRLLAIYGEHFGKALTVASFLEGEPDYAFDFSNYALAPRNVEKDLPFVEQSISWAEQRGDVLYVEHGHNTYAASSYGMTGYITAIDIRTGRALWHSAAQVANAANFTFLGDYLLTGYGFTKEPDYLYLLRTSDGSIAARIPVKSGPEEIVVVGEKVYVHTYRWDYVFRVKKAVR